MSYINKDFFENRKPAEGYADQLGDCRLPSSVREALLQWVSAGSLSAPQGKSVQQSLWYYSPGNLRRQD